MRYIKGFIDTCVAEISRPIAPKSSRAQPKDNEGASGSTSVTDPKAQAVEIKTLKAELDKAKKRMKSPTESDASGFSEQ